MPLLVWEPTRSSNCFEKRLRQSGELLQPTALRVALQVAAKAQTSLSERQEAMSMVVCSSVSRGVRAGRAESVPRQEDCQETFWGLCRMLWIVELNKDRVHGT